MKSYDSLKNCSNCNDDWVDKPLEKSILFNKICELRKLTFKMVDTSV